MIPGPCSPLELLEVYEIARKVPNLPGSATLRLHLARIWMAGGLATVHAGEQERVVGFAAVSACSSVDQALQEMFHGAEPEGAGRIGVIQFMYLLPKFRQPMYTQRLLKAAKLLDWMDALVWVRNIDGRHVMRHTLEESAVRVVGRAS